MSARSAAENASPRQLARGAGFFYLITIIAGVFAEMMVRGRLVVRDDAAATAANILSHERLFRLGLAADLVMLVAYIAVTLLLFILLRPVSRRVSLGAALFSLVGIAVLAVNSLNHLAPLILLGPHAPTAFDPAQLQSLALMSIRMHSRGYAVSGVFFGVYCVLVGYLALKSGFLPRLIGALMMLGGLGYLINSFTGFTSPALAARLPDTTILGGIGELALCLWLLVKGVNVSKWESCEQD
jgi:Domain of unknown function (DUF4386)